MAHGGRFILLLLCLTGMVGAQGQYNETIRSGRPGQSIGAFTVGKTVFQIQSGIDFLNSSNPVLETSSWQSTNVIRYGIREKIEISALISGRQDQITPAGLEQSVQSELSNAQLGLRYNILDNHASYIPSVGFQGRIRLPLTTGVYEISKLAPVLILATTQKLPSSLSLTTNWTADFNGRTATPTYKYTANLGFPVAEKVKGFAEAYGTFVYDFDIHLDAGIAFLVSPDLQLDLAAGFGENENIKDLMVSFGVSWRTFLASK